MNPQQPIGIFDSGIGGLTIAKSVVELLPREDIIYFGDTARLPYGDKSQATLQGYALELTDFLLNKNCKMILIACNSAAAAAFDEVQQQVAGRALVVNVIDPVISFLHKYSGKRIGLIGTKQTVGSKIYDRKIAAQNLKIELTAQATPLLVPAIEEGFVNNIIIEDILHEYLQYETLQNISALILGCTHYPVLKKQFNNYYQGAVEIIEPAPLVAESIKTLLEEHELLNPSGGRQQFFVSDFTDAFAHATKQFFGKDVSLIVAG